MDSSEGESLSHWLTIANPCLREMACKSAQPQGELFSLFWAGLGSTDHLHAAEAWWGSHDLFLAPHPVHSLASWFLLIPSCSLIMTPACAQCIAGHRALQAPVPTSLIRKLGLASVAELVVLSERCMGEGFLEYRWNKHFRRSPWEDEMG